MLLYIRYIYIYISCIITNYIYIYISVIILRFCPHLNGVGARDQHTYLITLRHSQSAWDSCVS